MPKASSIPPPAKSASTLIGGVGGWPARPKRLERAGEGEVVDVVACAWARSGPSWPQPVRRP